MESGYAAICDEVWLVTCAIEDQLRRLAGRGVSAEDAAQRARAQAGMVDRLGPSATLVLDTSGAPGAVHAQVDEALATAVARRANATDDRLGLGRAPAGEAPGAEATGSRSAPAS